MTSAKRFPGFLALVLLCAATGCQQSGTADHSKDRSTYTAARHRTLGSNIPQPDSVDTTNSKYDPNLNSTMNQTQTSIPGGSTGGR